ncbi:unnamed protein product [Brachionus calyciflorus]|uniref:Uncharacterized protein n=1 Tax=Brachionus calyciflorus TaxID=104777 RepID=A0A813WV24_9BILA|nr:unnamed protein product [Brachionus calyciflorus]
MKNLILLVLIFVPLESFPFDADPCKARALLIKKLLGGFQYFNGLVDGETHVFNMSNIRTCGPDFDKVVLNLTIMNFKFLYNHEDFNYFKNLIKFSITNSTLTHMVNTSKLNFLEELIIRKTSLDTLNNSRVLSPRLERIDLSDNKIELIQSNFFSNLKNLKFLNLTYNNLKIINDLQFDSNSLELIDLSFNSIQLFEKITFQNKKIHENFVLNLTRNSLKTFPNVFGNLKLVPNIYIGEQKTTTFIMNKNIVVPQNGFTYSKVNSDNRYVNFYIDSKLINVNDSYSIGLLCSRGYGNDFHSTFVMNNGIKIFEIYKSINLMMVRNLINGITKEISCALIPTTASTSTSTSTPETSTSTSTPTSTLTTSTSTSTPTSTLTTSTSTLTSTTEISTSTSTPTSISTSTSTSTASTSTSTLASSTTSIRTSTLKSTEISLTSTKIVSTISNSKTIEIKTKSARINEITDKVLVAENQFLIQTEELNSESSFKVKMINFLFWINFITSVLLISIFIYISYQRVLRNERLLNDALNNGEKREMLLESHEDLDERQ